MLEILGLECGVMWQEFDSEGRFEMNYGVNPSCKMGRAGETEMPDRDHSNSK